MADQESHKLVTVHDEAVPFNPATDCHPDPEVSGGDGCPNIVPCELRCHLRWLDDQDQPNDWLVKLVEPGRLDQ